jgi:hypothetical protein
VQPVYLDGFLEFAMGTEEGFGSRINAERELARRVLSRFGRFHLPLGLSMDLRKFTELETGDPEVYVASLQAWLKSLHALPKVQSSADPRLQTDPLVLRLDELARTDRLRIDEARARASQLETDWANDSQIYCRSMLSLQRMSAVQEAQVKGCKTCAKSAFTRFKAEVDQLEAVKELNEKKLRAKWGRKLYGRIHCD